MSVATRPRRKPAAKGKAESGARQRPSKGPARNRHGVYARPRKIEVPLRSSSKVTITLKLIEDATLPDDKRWRVGYAVQGMGFASSSPCNANQDGHPSEPAAVDSAIRSIERQLQGHLKSAASKTAEKRIQMALEDLHASVVWRAQRKMLKPGTESDRLSWPNSTSPPLPERKPKSRGRCPDPLGHIEQATGGALVPVTVAPRLNANERKTLAKAERTIEQGMRSFVEVGEALKRIQQGRLYRETHETFDVYCRDRWQVQRARAYQLIAAAEATRQLSVSTTVDKRTKTEPRPVPQNEAQVRPLLRVDQDQRDEVWDRAVARAKKEGKPAPTQAIVEETVREWITPEDELQARGENRKRKAETSPEPPVTSSPPHPATASPLSDCPDEEGWLYEVECVRSQIIRSLSVFPQWPHCHAEMARILRQLADGLEGVTG